LPIKPQCIRKEMRKAFGKDVCYVTTIGLSQLAAPQFLNDHRLRRADHVKVAQAHASRAIRFTRSRQIRDAFRRAQELMETFRTPVVVEIILERVINITKGAEIDNVVEFGDLTKDAADAPFAIALLD
jgi:tartronate-semialdehyde synthase